MTSEAAPALPDGRPVAPVSADEPTPRKNGHANGHHHANGRKAALITLEPLESGSGGAVALIDDPGSLGAAFTALPLGWAPVAFAGPFPSTDWGPLLTRRPVIIPANDRPGARHAAGLESYLRSIGIEASILALPAGLPAGWRIADGLPAGVVLFIDPPQPKQVPLGEMFTAEDLLATDFPPVEWIIEGWLPTGLALLVGPPKKGKSWMAMDFAVEVAAGRPVLGKIATNRCEVLCIFLEDPPRRLRSRLAKVLGCSVLGDGIVFATQWPTLDSGGLERLAGYLDTHPGCRLVVIDTFAKVRGSPDGRSGVYQQDYQDVGELHKFANERGIALILIHHTRKQDASDALDAISGSNAIAGAADTIMVLRGPRGDPLAKLTITGRDIIEDGEFAVKFDKETAKWTLLGPAAQVKAETEQQRIYELLLASDDAMQPADIASELGIGLPTVKTSLSRMKKRKVVWQPRYRLWGIAGRDYARTAPRRED